MATPSGKTSAASVSASAPPRTRLQRIVRRGLLILAGMFLLLTVVFFLIPVWISNDQGRAYVLERLNRRLNGPRVVIDRWSLGWFRASQLTNLRILHPDGTPLLSCPTVASGMTLWDLFWGNYDLRNTTADNLDMRIVKYSDGTTSLDAFAPAATDILRSARGAVQINNAQVELVSVKSNQSLPFHDVKATITIASPDAPFHIQIAALSTANSNLSLNAAFPPTRLLSDASARPGVWAFANDLEFSAAHLPTALTCDYLGIDAAWTDSLGDFLETLQFAGHPAITANDANLTFLLQASAASGEPPSMDARLLLRAPAGSAAAMPATVAIPNAEYHLDAALRLSPPLARLLGRLNPILAEAGPTSQNGLVHASVDSLFLTLDAPHLENARGTARFTFPPLLFSPNPGPSLVRQLQIITGELPPPAATTATAPALAVAQPRMPGSAGTLHARLADNQFSYENFLITLGKSRINCSGTVDLNGSVNLLADIPNSLAGSPLSAGTTRVVIMGPVEAPLIKRAE